MSIKVTHAGIDYFALGSRTLEKGKWNGKGQESSNGDGKNGKEFARKLWGDGDSQCANRGHSGKNPSGVPYHDNPPTGSKNPNSKKENHDGEISEAWVSQGNTRKGACHNPNEVHFGQHNPTPVTGKNPRENAHHNPGQDY